MWYILCIGGELGIYHGIPLDYTEGWDSVLGCGTSYEDVLELLLGGE